MTKVYWQIQYRLMANRSKKD